MRNENQRIDDALNRKAALVIEQIKIAGKEFHNLLIGLQDTILMIIAHKNLFHCRDQACGSR